MVVKDLNTTPSRRPGSVTMLHVEEVNAARARPHKTDGRFVEPREGHLKRTFSKTWCPCNCEKDFVGGIKENTKEHCLRDYFEQYRKTEVIEIMTDRGSGRREEALRS